VQLELVRHGVAELLLQEPVAVERGDAERRGKLLGDGRLAGAHEADQDESHPMRFS
jgi:hypothetical protein